MITLSKKRTNFNFECEINDYKFSGSCTFVDDKLSDFNSSIYPKENGSSQVGTVNGNYDTLADSDRSCSITVSTTQNHFSAIYESVETLVSELESQNNN